MSFEYTGWLMDDGGYWILDDGLTQTCISSTIAMRGVSPRHIYLSLCEASRLVTLILLPLAILCMKACLKVQRR
jgi:hypothetical protein